MNVDGWPRVPARPRPAQSLGLRAALRCPAVLLDMILTSYPRPRPTSPPIGGGRGQRAKWGEVGARFWARSGARYLKDPCGPFWTVKDP